MKKNLGTKTERIKSGKTTQAVIYRCCTKRKGKAVKEEEQEEEAKERSIIST